LSSRDVRYQFYAHTKQWVKPFCIFWAYVFRWEERRQTFLNWTVASFSLS
jgi:hypothetical protein